MSTGSDTLNIGSLRLQRSYPVAEVQSHQRVDPENHPKAAAAARARIAALSNAHPLSHMRPVPAAPTADLIVDRNILAGRVKHMPVPSVAAGRPLPTIVVPLLTAVGIFALVLLLFKAPIIVSQVSYTLAGHPQASPAAANAVPAVADIIPADDTITIPKINVHAPVEYIASTAEPDIQTALESGVVHYGNTALPGQVGNVAIFGHSSNDWWEPGNFKFVFVLLDKLVPGDRLTLDYNSTRYTYEVTSSTVVDPTDIGVLKPTATPTLTLITCSPPGTSLRRLVVTAKQVDPDPNQAVATAKPAPAAPSTLPSSAPGFFNQVGQAWNGIVQGFTSLFGGATNTTAPTTPGTTAPDQLPAVK